MKTGLIMNLGIGLISFMNNDFVSVFNQYGWTAYYFTGIVTGVFISLFVGALGLVVDAVNEWLEIRAEEKRFKKHVEKLRLLTSEQTEKRD